MIQHVAQPVRALAQHVGEQPLDQAPTVVEPLEEELQVRGELRLLPGREQRLARRGEEELLGAGAHRQLTAGAGRQRQLAGEPEVERVYGLDAQPPRILRQPPAALPRAPQRRGRELAQALALRIGGDLAAQRPHARGRASPPRRGA